MKLVYIGGYGRSGSTLLEYLMAANAQVIACGEVASARRARRKRTKCSCGQVAQDCQLWGPFLAQSKEHLRHAELDLALLRRVSGAYSVMVDSSKTAWSTAATPFRLRRKLGKDFTLVHIVRDPRAVCWSLVKRSQRRGQRSYGTLLCIKGAAGWLFANLACELFHSLYPDRYRRIRYEDLVRSPAELLPPLLPEIQSLGQWQLESIGRGGNRHQLLGNRMRRQPLSLDDIKNDDAWQTEMPKAQRQLVGALTWPLKRRYAY